MSASRPTSLQQRRDRARDDTILRLGTRVETEVGLIAIGLVRCFDAQSPLSRYALLSEIGLARLLAEAPEVAPEGAAWSKGSVQDGVNLDI